jgi:Flp pilus assembly protein TadG
MSMNAAATARRRGLGWNFHGRLLRDCRAGVAVLVALTLPVLAGFGALGIEQSHAHFQKLLLEQTVEASALAGANKIATYYTSGNTTTAIVAAAQTIALANMPTSQIVNGSSVQLYGTVVPTADVVVGNWNATTSTFVSLAASGGTTPDAVQVTGLETRANGNPIKLFFGSLIGYSTYDITATAVASYGTGQTFNTIVVNDLSQSFLTDISAQQAADTAILKCISSAASASSKFGITTINGSSWTYVPLTVATSTAIQPKINALTSCISPYCSTGSNVASGLYSAIQQYSGSAYANSKNNIIIITDGVPDVHSGLSYLLANGTGPTLNPVTAAVCSLLTCTNANLLTMARNQAAAARAAGISISTIYYSGDTVASSSACTQAGLSSSCTNAQLQAAYAASLASLTGGTGISLVAPTTTTISSTFAAFCSTMASSVKQTM